MTTPQKPKRGPLLLSTRTQTTAFLTIRQPRISRPSPPLHCIWDDTKVLDFAAISVEAVGKVPFPRNQRRRCSHQQPEADSYEWTRNSLWFSTDSANLLLRQINFVGKRRPTVFTFFFFWDGLGKDNFAVRPLSLWMAVSRHGISQ